MRNLNKYPKITKSKKIPLISQVLKYIIIWKTEIVIGKDPKHYYSPMQQHACPFSVQLKVRRKFFSLHNMVHVSLVQFSKPKHCMWYPTTPWWTINHAMHIIANAKIRKFMLVAILCWIMVNNNSAIAYL